MQLTLHRSSLHRHAAAAGRGAVRDADHGTHLVDRSILDCAHLGSTNRCCLDGHSHRCNGLLEDTPT